MIKAEIDVWVRPRTDSQELGSDYFRSYRSPSMLRQEEGEGKNRP